MTVKTEGVFFDPPPIWRLRKVALEIRRPLIMGIINMTPDSFSDGGRFTTAEQALQEALAMVAGGADLLDIGGESTRPGAQAVTVQEELERVVPLIRSLRRRTPVPLSIDTRHARVAGAALEAGADIVNDISALSDPDMADLVAASKAGLVLMHSRGDPETMSSLNSYADLPQEVTAELADSVKKALSHGIRPEAICLDPGFGFAKVGMQNYELLRGLEHIVNLGYPVMVGASRKSFVGQVLSAGWGAFPERQQPPFRPVTGRLSGSLVFASAAVWRGAHIIRVHDVVETCDALQIAVHCTD